MINAIKSDTPTYKNKGTRKEEKQMYCPKCGAENADDADYCSKCGNKLISGANGLSPYADDGKIYERQEKAKVVGALIDLGICFVVFLICVITYNNDKSQLWGYNYRSPLTTHELMVVCGGIGSLGGMIYGVIMLMVPSKKPDNSKISTNSNMVFCCPNCKSRKLQMISETVALSSSRRFWLCQDCGNKFRVPHEVKQEAEHARKSSEKCKFLTIFYFVCVPIILWYDLKIAHGGILRKLWWVYGLLLMGMILFPIEWRRNKSQAEKLDQEYEYIMDNCREKGKSDNQSFWN